MSIKTAIIATVSLLLATPFAFADGSFHVYAPSRSTGSLLIVKAEPTLAGLSLSLAKKVELGFPAGTITSNPEKRLLYVAAPRPDKKDKASGAVIAIDKEGGYLRHKNVTLEHGYSYLSLDRKRRFLLGAYYFGGQVDVYSLDGDGQVAKRVAALDENRRNAHCVLPSPDNRFVYIPYVKDTNALFQYRFDADSGSLTALKPLNANPPEGTGPRHMAYHPKLPIVYFSNEQHIGVSVYDKTDGGRLKVRQICNAIGDDQSKQGISSSDILITPDAQFVFAGIRGHQRDFDWISRYRVKKNGELELLGLTPADKIPWGLTLSPDGRFLIVTAFQGATLNAYHIAKGGELRKVASLPIDKQITDVVTLAP